MANLISKKDPATRALESVVHNLDILVKDPNNNNVFRNQDNQRFVTSSLESLTTSDWERYQHSAGDAEMLLARSDVFGMEAFREQFGDLPEHSLKAASILAMAAGNLAGYNSAQNEAKLAQGVNSLGMETIYHGQLGGSLNISDAHNAIVSKESFDEKSLNDFLNYSIVFNALASRQDAFNALFFKPLSVTPDEVGYRVSVRVEQVWFGNEHDPNGDPNVISKRNLIDALIHPEVLESNATDVIPYVQTAGVKENTKHFVSDTLIKPYKRLLDNVEVETAPLKVNMQHDLLGLSSHPALIANGLMNEKDSLDSRVSLRKLFLKCGDQLVQFDVAQHMTAGGFKSVEGDFRTLSLTFENPAFLVSEKLTAIDETPVAIFKDLVDSGYEVRLNVSAYGKVQVDHSHIIVNAGPVSIAAVMKDGQEVPFNNLDASNPLKAKLDALALGEDSPKVTLVGYEVEARRTNYDLRTSGRFIDSTEYTEQIMIPLRSPVSIVKPIVGGEKAEPNIKSLVVAAHIQANNDGVKTILNHAEQLKVTTSNKNWNYNTDRFGIAGIGRHFIQPCYIEETWHLPAMINSVSSENRLKDIQGAVSTRVNELIGRVLQRTNYIPVVEQMTGGNPGKVQVAIGTDYRLPQYFVTQGDERLFGGAVDYAIASTPNKNMANKVVMTLTRKDSSEGPDPFSYGTFVWTPELMVSTTMQRGAQTYLQHMVQPRYLHIVNLPILLLIHVTGIEEVTGEQTVLPIVNFTKEEAGEAGNTASQVTIKPTKSSTGTANNAAGGATPTTPGTTPKAGS